MKIKSIHVKKFRGFNDVTFSMGENITVITGKNGTQKTTLLGMLSQPFSITDKSSSLYKEIPLCGGSYKSAFSEKFKFSEKFDVAKEHEWTINFDNGMNPVTVVSMTRSKTNNIIRFWNKSRKASLGYSQKPVIFLSLKRLLPIGEDDDLNESKAIELTPDEMKFYSEWHNRILIDTSGSVKTASYIASKHKNSLAAETDHYDWKLNSSGQDNIGKILLAVLSFKRLQATHQQKYPGGILAIDELDATLYPGSQIKLLDALRKFSSKFNIQIIFTTHSLTILEKSCDLQCDEKIKDQVKVVFLEKKDGKINSTNEIAFESIKNKLNKSIGAEKSILKLPVFTEDAEAITFAKCLLKSSRIRPVNFIEANFGSPLLVTLTEKAGLGLFKFPESIIILDGDVGVSTAAKKKLAKIKNVLTLPGDASPERVLAKFLYELSDTSEIWSIIHRDYEKDICFNEITYDEIIEDRDKAKAWFKAQSKRWGRLAYKVIDPWAAENEKSVSRFLAEFDALINEISKQRELCTNEDD